MGYPHEAPFEPLHDRLPYAPAPDRPVLQWPGGKGVAVWVVPNVEHYEYLPLPASPDPWPRAPHPDVRKYAYHDYGNRVAFWRMLEVIDRHRVPCTLSLNLAVLDHYPEIAEAVLARRWAVMSHGLYNTRYVSGLDLEEERAFYGDCNEIARRHLGSDLRGMLGPFITANAWTPDLMAEVGMRYHADWVHDDTPSPLRTRTGRLVALPYTYELNDGPLMRAHIEGAGFAQRCLAQFDQLLREFEEDGRGRMMCVSVHPFAIAQPHRITYFDRVLEHIAGSDRAWLATADEIVDHYLAACHDADLKSHHD